MVVIFIILFMGEGEKKMKEMKHISDTPTIRKISKYEHEIVIVRKYVRPSGAEFTINKIWDSTTTKERAEKIINEQIISMVNCGYNIPHYYYLNL